jgi:hypothetical protein
LQIRIHDDHGLALSCVHASADRNLVAEIARELNESVARITFSLGIEHNRRAIFASVINENHFHRPVKACEQRIKAVEKKRDDRLLIENGDDKGVEGSRFARVGHRLIR